MYIDGFNFYHGLMAKYRGRYRWLSYRALLDRFLLADQELVALKYFTTEVTHQPDKLARQRVYLKALEEHGGVEIHRGVFETRKVKCRVCTEWYGRPQEKQTDVNIATHLLVDAFDDQFDMFVLLSADSDLLPAVSTVINRFEKPMLLVEPPRRHSPELQSVARSTLHVPRHWLNQCQLPDPVQYVKKGRTKSIYCPDDWRPGTGVTNP